MSNKVTFPLASVLESNKLDGTNFSDWYCNLKIILKQAKKEHILETALPDAPADNAPRAEKAAYEKLKDDSNEVSCLMLVSMTPDLQRRLEDWSAFDMITELKSLYQEQARVERHNVATELFSCRMAEGASVKAHVQKMIGLIEKLGKLSNAPMELDYATDLILYSLPASYSIFIMNYNMAGAQKSLSELHSMLSTAEGSIRRVPEVLAVNQAGKKVRKGKANKKGKKK